MSDFSMVLPPVTGYDYVQAGTPSDPDVGETWFDTDETSGPVGKVWDGSNWVEESAPQAGTALTLSSGAYNVDGVSTSELSFDPATQTEFNNHAGDADAHHTKTPEASLSATSGLPSRSLATWYQNTTGGPLMVTVTTSSTAYLEMNVNSSQNFRAVAEERPEANEQVTCTVIVPDGWYYQASANATLEIWHEQEMST